MKAFPNPNPEAPDYWAQILTAERVSHYVRQTADWLERKPELDFDPSEAEDMVQEALAHIVEFDVRFNPDLGYPGNALGQWVRRQVYSYLQLGAQDPLLRSRGCRSARDRTNRAVSEQAPLPPLPGPDEDEVLQGRLPPEVRAYMEEVIREGHRRAPDRYWRICRLMYLEELPGELIAELEGVSLPRLMTLLQKIRVTLRASDLHLFIQDFN